MKLSVRERMQRSREKYLTLGLCTVCKERPNRPGRLACEECAKQQAEQERQKRLDRRTAKVCHQCTNPQLKPGRSLCHKCFDDQVERSTKANKKRKIERLKGRRCLNCNTPTCAIGRTYCEKCLIKRRLKNYKLTEEEFKSLGNKCKICEGSVKLSVDHDHITGKVRGMLCSNCNRGLGYFKDDPIRLRAAADYLEHTKELTKVD